MGTKYETNSCCSKGKFTFIVTLRFGTSQWKSSSHFQRIYFIRRDRLRVTRTSERILCQRVHPEVCRARDSDQVSRLAQEENTMPQKRHHMHVEQGRDSRLINSGNYCCSYLTRHISHNSQFIKVKIKFNVYNSPNIFLLVFGSLKNFLQQIYLRRITFIVLTTWIFINFLR